MMDSEMANTIQADVYKIPSSDLDVESGMFENGIMAGDLDSLLEMFEEAETVLSSSVDCISLTQTDNLTDSNGVTDANVQVSHSSGHSDINECAVSALDVCVVAENVTSEELEDRTCHASSSNGSDESGISGDMLCFADSVEPTTTDIGLTDVKSSADGTENEDLCFDETSLELASFPNSASESSADVAPGPWSPMSQDKRDGGTWTRSDAGNSTAVIPGFFSAGETFFQKYESETSSDCDDDYPSEDKYSDSSSSPSSSSDTPCQRGRGSTARRDGPRRQQGRGRVRPTEEETLYDRLPSYYTVLSRPNRTPTGLIRSSRSCLKLILNSDLPSRDRDPSPDRQSHIFDKVPSYQSCFTNSTRYDEDSEMSVKFDSGGAYVDKDGPRLGRGHGSGSSYAHSRPRFRSRSRLRSAASVRHKRSVETVNEDNHSSSVTTSEKIDVAETRFSAHGRHSLGTDSQNAELELNENKQKQQQQRRIVYIGGIPSTLTAEKLKEIFEQFGQIEKCTVHFRECGDNYGFVTYVQSYDACKAVEGGCRLPGCKRFDICFGGRRNFCRADYFDLDGNVEMEEELAPVIPRSKATQDFDRLLMDELLKRKL